MDSKAKKIGRKVMAQICRRIFATSLITSALIAFPAYAENPVHLDWADDIAQNVLPENNTYGSNPTYIQWLGVNGATQYENRTQCSSFITRVLKHAYNWSDSDFKSWFGSTSPTAAVYHDHIMAENGFSALTAIQDIAPGDVIAVKYPSGLSSTGHVMLVRSAPAERTASAPLVSGTRQYDVEIIDSSQSGHGSGDSRLMADKSWDSGAGIGIFRLYANENSGEIVGYTWSTYSNSLYYDQNSRHLIVGRLQ